MSISARTSGDEAALRASPVFSNRPQSASEWQALASKSLGGNQVSQALWATARAAACEARIEPLVELLAEHAEPRPEEAALELAEQVATEAGHEFAAMAEAMLQGGDPAALLRACALLLDQRQRPCAALDYLNAAILLAPDRPAYLFTRGLLLASLGLDIQALKDAESLSDSDPDRARFLTQCVQVLFPAFDFWPSRAALGAEGRPMKLGQPAAAISAAFQRYATRLSLLRAKLAEYVKPGVTVRWMPPDLTPLLPKGPLKLSAKDDVDETRGLDAATLPDLLLAARGDWAALSWLSWACGLTSVAPLKTIRPAKTLGVAVAQAAEWLNGCRKAQQGGKAIGFEDFDALEPALVPMAAAQYTELNAMFQWLVDAQVSSPWRRSFREVAP